MSSSLPDEWKLRPGRADDLESLTEMLSAEERAIRGQSRWGPSDTADWWRALAAQGEAWVVEDADGAPAAVVGLFQRQDLFNCWISVAPMHFGRGLDASLLEYAESRTRARGGTVLNVDAFAENATALNLFRERGYEEERRHYLMQIDFHVPPPEPEWPPAITCARFDPDRDARAFYDAMVESFEGQWGFRRHAFEDWMRIRLEAPDFDPTIWFVAREGGDVVAVLRGDAKRWSCGWIGMLGVRPSWRRRGLGSALLRHAFRAFYDRGERCVGLGVDTQNPTGATLLYEQAGMRVVAESITYAKALG